MKVKLPSKSKEDCFEKVYKIYKSEIKKLTEKIKMIEGATESEVNQLKDYINNLYIKTKREFWDPVERYSSTSTVLNSEQTEMRSESTCDYSKLKENITNNKEKLKQKLRTKYYEEILNKLQDDFKGKLMNELTERFIDYICYKCKIYKIPTEGTQIKNQIMMNLKKYIYLALAPKIYLNIRDNMALDTLCMLLSEIMFQILFESQKLKRNKSSKERPPNSNSKTNQQINQQNQNQIRQQIEEDRRNAYFTKQNEYFILVIECLKELAIRGAEKRLKRKYGRRKKDSSIIVDYGDDESNVTSFTMRSKIDEISSTSEMLKGKISHNESKISLEK